MTAAIAAARTRVCQPVDRFELDLPDPALGPASRILGRLGGIVVSTRTSDGGDAGAEAGAAGGAGGRRGDTVGDGYTTMVGTLPAAAVPDLAARLPDLTGGEGVLTHRLDHYAPVTSATPPTRRRAGPDPGDRATWFRERPR
ncbi:MAG: hypothetical protein ACRCY9_13305 [Phycicoccus sp.]